MLSRLGRKADVEVLLPADVLCDDTECRTHDGDTLLYVDNGHLTREGARYLVDGLGLRERPQRVAD